MLDEKATPAQMRKAHAMMRQLGLDTDDRHAFQEREVGKSSMTDMSNLDMKKLFPAIRRQARQMGIKLRDDGHYKRNSPQRHRGTEKREALVKVTRGITKAQQNKIWQLATRIGMDGDMVDSFMQKRIVANRVERVEQMTIKEASKLIEALKARADRGDYVIQTTKPKDNIIHVDFGEKEKTGA